MYDTKLWLITKKSAVVKISHCLQATSETSRVGADKMNRQDAEREYKSVCRVDSDNENTTGNTGEGDGHTKSKNRW